jgi:hypothetical protein
MRSLTNFDLLTIWDRGGRLHPLDRGLLMLSAALPEVPSDSLSDWTLGKRNRALAELHSCCFGRSLVGWLACGRCGEKMEFEMDSRELAAPGDVGEASETATIEVKGRSFRLPTSRDLAFLAADGDSGSAPVRLLERCQVDTSGKPDEWANEEIEEVGREMAQADPMAEIRISSRCPACAHESSETLDLAAFLWEEIEGHAKRLLFEVHAIASAYGWSEQEILSLSDSRRSLYMGMVQP